MILPSEQRPGQQRQLAACSATREALLEGALVCVCPMWPETSISRAHIPDSRSRRSCLLAPFVNSSHTKGLFEDPKYLPVFGQSLDSLGVDYRLSAQICPRAAPILPMVGGTQRGLLTAWSFLASCGPHLSRLSCSQGLSPAEGQEGKPMDQFPLFHPFSHL